MRQEAHGLEKEKEEEVDTSYGEVDDSHWDTNPSIVTEVEEAQQIHETLQRSTVEKSTSNIPYLEGIGPLTFPLLKKALEEVAKRKTEMEATRV